LFFFNHPRLLSNPHPNHSFLGTPGVAAGKIRDQADYPYLIRVNYEPVLESNSSLIEGKLFSFNPLTSIHFRRLPARLVPSG
jgi:hypothetical protein